MRQERGFGMLGLISLLGIISVVVLEIVGLNVHIMKFRTLSANMDQVEVFARNFVEVIQDDPSWAVTRAQNASMNCLSTGCPLAGPAAAQTFALYNSTGQLFYNGTNAANGLTLTGKKCGPDGEPPFTSHSFPSTDCPLQYNLVWYPLTTKPNSIVAIKATLVVGENSPIKINSLRFSFDDQPGQPNPPPIIQRNAL